LSPDELCGVRYSCFRPLKKGMVLAVHDGAVWDIAASQGGEGAGVHGLVLSAGADGVCAVITAALRLSTGNNVFFPLSQLTNSLAVCAEGFVSYTKGRRGDQNDRRI
jgi:hypothetical protein